jgi:tRNA(fMet)-specific endonuclease VapC
LDGHIKRVGLENVYISEITVAELKYGAENSDKVEHNKGVVNFFIERMNILPIYGGLDIYAKEKARLRRKGKLIDEFDLLIGSTAIENKLILVTNNERHFKRLEDIEIDNWTR